MRNTFTLTIILILATFFSGCVIIGSDLRVQKVKDSEYAEATATATETIQGAVPSTILRREIPYENLPKPAPASTSSFVISLVDQRSGTYTEIQSLIISEDTLALRMITKDKKAGLMDTIRIVLDRRYFGESSFTKTPNGYVIDQSSLVPNQEDDFFADSAEIRWNTRLYLKDFQAFVIDEQMLHLYTGIISSNPYETDAVKFVVLNDITDPKDIEDSFRVFFLFNNDAVANNERCRQILQLKPECKDKRVELSPYGTTEGFFYTTILCTGTCKD